jgi:hypothetical protein
MAKFTLYSVILTTCALSQEGSSASVLGRSASMGSSMSLGKSDTQHTHPPAATFPPHTHNPAQPNSHAFLNRPPALSGVTAPPFLPGVTAPLVQPTSNPTESVTYSSGSGSGYFDDYSTTETPPAYSINDVTYFNDDLLNMTRIILSSSTPTSSSSTTTSSSSTTTSSSSTTISSSSTTTSSSTLSFNDNMNISDNISQSKAEAETNESNSSSSSIPSSIIAAGACVVAVVVVVLVLVTKKKQPIEKLRIDKTKTNTKDSIFNPVYQNVREQYLYEEPHRFTPINLQGEGLYEDGGYIDSGEALNYEEPLERTHSSEIVYTETTNEEGYGNIGLDYDSQQNFYDNVSGNNSALYDLAGNQQNVYDFGSNTDTLYDNLPTSN